MLSLWGQVNNQNLYGYQSLRNNLNSACGGISSSHPLSVNERIEIQRGVGVDINYQGGSGGFSYHPKTIQYAPRPRSESNSIDFSQSLTQIRASLWNNLNANPNKGFDVISACTDTW